ncbi:MAG TPA: hypothetical protein DD473_04575 [Planctomycetaceae bacterium]|nr:hypothetical protein [Planctomycetaceae bacterium]
MVAVDEDRSEKAVAVVPAKKHADLIATAGASRERIIRYPGGQRARTECGLILIIDADSVLLEPCEIVLIDDKIETSACAGSHLRADGPEQVEPGTGKIAVNNMHAHVGRTGHADRDTGLSVERVELVIVERDETGHIRDRRRSDVEALDGEASADAVGGQGGSGVVPEGLPGIRGLNDEIARRTSYGRPHQVQVDRLVVSPIVDGDDITRGGAVHSSLNRCEVSSPGIINSDG